MCLGPHTLREMILFLFTLARPPLLDHRPLALSSSGASFPNGETPAKIHTKPPVNRSDNGGESATARRWASAPQQLLKTSMAIPSTTFNTTASTTLIESAGDDYSWQLEEAMGQLERRALREVESAG